MEDASKYFMKLKVKLNGKEHVDDNNISEWTTSGDGQKLAWLGVTLRAWDSKLGDLFLPTFSDITHDDDKSKC